MMRRWLRIAALAAFAALTLLPLPAGAWNAAGHRLSALIAWQQLDQSTREEVSRLLERHPDHERWTARAKGLAPELAAFLEASTWPDDIKGDKRFYDANKDEATKLLPGFPDMARHRHWHYIDRPLGHTPKQHETDGELERRLDLLANTVGNRNAGDQQRAYALPWLIHLVADAHQPLHTASRYDAEGRGDEGGNLLIIKHPFHPRLSSMSLHTYWDDLPGPPWLRGRYLERSAAALIAAHPAPPHAGEAKRWIDESWQIAHDGAYPQGDESTPTLTADFHAEAQAVARTRVTDAGYRLAALLQKLLGQKP
jgi:hypothetical protein